MPSKRPDAEEPAATEADLAETVEEEPTTEVDAPEGAPEDAAEAATEAAEDDARDPRRDPADYENPGSE